MDLLGMERLLAKKQETWEIEYNYFVKELSTFVNRMVNEFRCSKMPMDDSIRDFHIYSTHVHDYIYTQEWHPPKDLCGASNYLCAIASI